MKHLLIVPGQWKVFKGVKVENTCNVPVKVTLGVLSVSTRDKEVLMQEDDSSVQDIPDRLKLENAVRAAAVFLGEFDIYYGNTLTGPSHPKFFDPEYYALRQALKDVGLIINPPSTHPDRLKAEAALRNQGWE